MRARMDVMCLIVSIECCLRSSLSCLELSSRSYVLFFMPCIKKYETKWRCDLLLLICYLQGLTEDLKRPPDTLEDLKFVLRVIADIRDKSLDVELRYVDLQERYRTLLMYDIEVTEKKITLRT